MGKPLSTQIYLGSHSIYLKMNAALIEGKKGYKRGYNQEPGGKKIAPEQVGVEHLQDGNPLTTNRMKITT